MNKPKRGRPPLATADKKAAMFCVRLSAEDRATIEQAAEAAGLKVSDWARATLLAVAAKSQ